MIIKKLVGLLTLCVLAGPIYADAAEDHQSCVKAITAGDKPGESAPGYKVVVDKWCDCLVARVDLIKAGKEKKEDSNTLSKICLFTALIHYETDDLETNTSTGDMTKACNSMFDVNKAKTTDADRKMLAEFCECAQPKLLDLFKKSEAMSDKQYDDGVYSVAEQCSTK